MCCNISVSGLYSYNVKSIVIILKATYSYTNQIIFVLDISKYYLEERICRALGGAGLGGVSNLATLNRYF